MGTTTATKTKRARPHKTKAAARQQAPVPPREEWTVGGKPIADDVAHLIPFENTDQGIEQLNATEARGGPKVTVRDRFDRQIEARADAGEGKIHPWTAPDPAKEAVDRVRKPGFRNRLLSRNMIDKRGKRGWEIAKDPKTGEPATMGDRMLIGEMPEDVAQQRNEFYRGQANDAVREAEEHFQAEQDRILSDGAAVGIRPLKPGEDLRDTRDGERVATVGLRSQRGNAAHFTE
jgi:hypothetical protein